ncbi:hypothetical protein os4_17930 [Comamonadaceae bacterium OS-4]|nr:hypothetical protein os4_17930 [Comamonadaceae bacterium OS-4]
MADLNVTPRTPRTQIVGSLGMRVRVAKPGETEEQKAKWRERIAKGGHVSVVLPTEEAKRDFLQRFAESEREVAAMQSFNAYARQIVAMYESGELVPSAKAQKPYPQTWAQRQVKGH